MQTLKPKTIGTAQVLLAAFEEFEATRNYHGGAMQTLTDWLSTVAKACYRNPGGFLWSSENKRVFEACI